MEERSTRLSNRERILIELKNIIKQVYHETVNHELSSDNVTYITHTLLKRLEESLIFGLKQPQNGYWKIIKKILHPDSLIQLSLIPGFSQSSLTKCRAWISLALLEDAFVSYMNCFVLEKILEKYYESWSILRHSDSCHSFLSLLSGLENVSFDFEMMEAMSWPVNCKLTPRNISSCEPWSPALSLTDSGVQLDRSDDYLNGNVMSASVTMRRKAKNPQRHVSFHEDSLAKSPSQRKLRWDVENSRYSWAGEELDNIKLPGLGATRVTMERGAPEGEESPNSNGDIRSVVIRPSSSIKRARRLSSRKVRMNIDALTHFTRELDAEVRSFQRRKSFHEVDLPEKLSVMLGLKGIKTWTYKLWGKVLILTHEIIVILHKDLHTTVLTLPQVEQVVIFPHAHEMHLLTRKLTHVLRCGEQSLAHEVLTRLAFHLHVAGFPNINFRILYPEDMTHVKQVLVNRRVLTEDACILYMGLVRLQPSDEKPPALEPVEKQGSLMYQVGRGQGWLPAHVVLRGEVLYIYGESRSPLAVINLLKSCGGCERSTFPDRPHTFSLILNHAPNIGSDHDNDFYQDLALCADASPYSSSSRRWMGSALRRWTNGKPASEALGRWLSDFLHSGQGSTYLHFAAADEYDMSDWLQTLLTVFCQGNKEKQWECEPSEASLVITDDTVILFTQPADSQCGFRLLASALIHEIATFSVGSNLYDSYCIIEFECMEAGSATFDWVLHFGSRKELEQSQAIVKSQWHLDTPFPISLVDEPRCSRTQECLAREWFA